MRSTEPLTAARYLRGQGTACQRIDYELRTLEALRESSFDAWGVPIPLTTTMFPKLAALFASAANEQVALGNEDAANVLRARARALRALARRAARIRKAH